jgi:hypothetical protein
MKSRQRSICLVVVSVLLGSCGSKTTGDGEQIIVAVARTLASGPNPICVDQRTHGDALTIWPDIQRLLRGAAGTLGWSAPVPLVPPAEVKYVAQIAGGPQVRVIEPKPVAAPLPRALVQRIQVAATKLSMSERDDDIVIVPDIPRVSSRFWLLDRLQPRCAYSYRLSHPAQLGGIAFVAADANHWGTIYALERGAKGWRPVARLTPWMY